ncbi:transcriptional regulator [Actibacterium mucosum KCTC 23349]|uniref:Transcriptional regulator n=1 Tax=Actibacterium mucosum KCTC 23349 TaxID=1454373 RepID=A0A037ZMC4_9RHOB|nr:helix-turn-helix domain-containing protein [Actibacterium mucosum]KAJ55936.1 transcriptional regulator [Actibacterium mucosum KCTC 23349]
MYEPTGHGRDKVVNDVDFAEAAPPADLQAVVHRALRVQTRAPLATDYRFHALPDACAYVVLNQRDPAIAGVTRLRASSEELNLGRDFHFVNMRLLPGVWQGPRLSYGQVEAPYDGDLPLLALNRSIAGHSFDTALPALWDFARNLVGQGLLKPNPVTQAIFARIVDIHSVADMAAVAGLSTRQLQRVLKSTAGFTPHDFLKVLRLQQSLRGTPSLSYADQSHFIHAFRRATGYTPGQYARKFNV